MDAEGVQVEVYQDATGAFHYQAFRAGTKDARLHPTMCGLEVGTLRKVAWFAVGDRRGRVHYDKACDDCRALLVY